MASYSHAKTVSVLSVDKTDKMEKESKTLIPMKGEVQVTFISPQKIKKKQRLRKFHKIKSFRSPYDSNMHRR